MEALRKLKTEKTQEAKEFKLRLEHLKTHKDTAGRLRTEVDVSTQRAREAQEKILQLQQEIEVFLTPEALAVGSRAEQDSILCASTLQRAVLLQHAAHVRSAISLLTSTISQAVNPRNHYMRCKQERELLSTELNDKMNAVGRHLDEIKNLQTQRTMLVKTNAATRVRLAVSPV